MKRERILGLNRNVFYMGLVSLLNDFSNEMIQSVMPVFLGSVLGVSPLMIGLLEGFSDALSSMIKIISGGLSDYTKKRKLWAFLGYLISISIRPLYIYASTFPQILQLRLTDRVGKGLRDAPRDALISESSKEADLGKSFGYHRAMDAIGGTAGPAFAVLLVSIFQFSYSKLFLTAFIVGVLALLSFSFIKEVSKVEVKDKIKLDFSLIKKHANFSYFLLAVFIFGMGSLPMTLILLRPLEIGASLTMIPLMYLIYNITFVISAIPLGKLSDFFGEKIVIASGFILAIISYLILSLASTIPLIIFSLILLGVYSAATDGIQRSLTSKLVQKEVLATGQGLLHASIGLSSLIAGFVGGSIWTILGSSYAFTYGASVAFIGFLFFLSITYFSNKKRA